jgi:diadenosine tetraphosphate (Ap4A) HIT family hydrolase
VNPSSRPDPNLDTLVRSYRHWAVHLRLGQVTLGSLVLASLDPAPTMASLPLGAFQELKQVMAEVEATLSSLFRYDKINYLVLMMVDPQVHFHVIPRYGSPRSFRGVPFQDPDWPRPADTLRVHPTPAALLESLRNQLRDHWLQAGADQPTLAQ